MFCTNCGKQIADDAKFCPHCGSQTVINTESVSSSPQQQPETARQKAPVKSKNKNKVLVGVGAAAVIIVLVLGAAVLFGGSGDRDRAIQTVKSGYLGTFTDVTVEEILNYTFTGDINGDGIIWDGGTNDEGEMIVEARYTDSNAQETRLQFRMMDEETFRYGGMTDISELTDAVTYLNMIYYNYYVFENPGDLTDTEAVVDRLDQVSCGAVLCGASADYEGDRETLYQPAFDLEPLPATAANYLGLLQTAPAESFYDTSAYDNILGGYYIALADGYSASMLEENHFNPLCAYYDSSQIGYAIQDIDQNGVPELLIGEMGEWGGGSGAFLDLYTLVDGQAVLVAASSERDRYYLCQDGTIAYEGSSGADDSFNAYYTISSATGARLILEAVLYQGFYADGGPWFYTTLEPWEASVSDGSQVEISESDAAQIMESHPYTSIAFEAIPAV